MELKITKRVLLEEQNNDMCHNWFFLVYGKILNDEKTLSRKFKFVEWLDVFDIQDWSEDGTPLKENMRAWSIASSRMASSISRAPPSFRAASMPQREAVVPHRRASPRRGSSL